MRPPARACLCPESSTVSVQQEVSPLIRSTTRPMNLVAKAVMRFGEEDCLYRCQDNTYPCSAGQTLFYRYTSVENGMTLHQ
jgi:hypothetical protein